MVFLELCLIYSLSVVPYGYKDGYWTVICFYCWTKGDRRSFYPDGSKSYSSFGALGLALFK